MANIMANLYKYLLFFIIGLILFILFNNKDNFSVGGVGWAAPKFPNADPNARDSWDMYNYYFNDSIDRIHLMAMYPNAIIIDDFPAIVGNVETYTMTPINGIGPWTGYAINFTQYGNQPGMPGMGMDGVQAPGSGARGFEQGGPGGPGGPGGSGGSGGLFSRFVSSCAALVPSIGIDISGAEDTDILDDFIHGGRLTELPNVRPYHFSVGVTKDELESDYHYNFGDDIMDGLGIDYRLYDVDDTGYREMGGSEELRLKQLYAQSGNSQPSYALYKLQETSKLYYLTLMSNGVEYLVARALISINGNFIVLRYMTTLPMGNGYGTKLMELLASLRTTTQNPDYMIQINMFAPSTYKPYRNMFRKSVTIWPTIAPDNFSIFKPMSNTMEILYFANPGDYDILYFRLYNYNSNQRSHFNLFLMRLDEDTIKDILSDLNPQNIAYITTLYIEFVVNNNF